MRRTAITTLLATAALVVSCSKGEPRSWAFMLTVGGLRVDSPLISETGGWALPVLADVSGTKTFTTKPTALNSALACDTGAAVEGMSIFVTVFTELSAGAKSASCPFIQLGKIPSGVYSVFYRGQNEPPVLLGEVRVGL
jgi:hypothetical protein